MGARRRRVAEAVLLLVGISFGLLALEGLVRLFSPVALPRGGYPVVRGGASFRPENRAGYRDVEHDSKKAPGVHRAVFVGDSFTYGAGVLFDDTYAQRVARGLRADRGERWEAVVLARPGIATAEQARMVREEAFSYEPDMLFLGYVLNDAESSDAAERRRADEWRDAQRRPEDLPLWRRSALANLAADRVRATLENRRRIANYRSLYQDDQPGYRAALQGVKEMAELAHAHKVPLIVAVFPLYGNPMDESYPFEEVHKKLVAAFRPLGVIVVDLLPYYRGLDWRLLVVEGAADEHPNEIAHRIAAEAILRTVNGPLNHAAPPPFPGNNEPGK